MVVVVLDWNKEEWKCGANKVGILEIGTLIMVFVTKQRGFEVWRW